MTTTSDQMLALTLLEKAYHHHARSVVLLPLSLLLPSIRFLTRNVLRLLSLAIATLQMDKQAVFTTLAFQFHLSITSHQVDINATLRVRNTCNRKVEQPSSSMQKNIGTHQKDTSDLPKIMEDEHTGGERFTSRPQPTMSA